MTTVQEKESSQWLSVTEETLFLHDGLIRVTDLVELPHDVNTTQEQNEVITFDLKNPAELSERLLAVCGTHNNAYSKLLEYRLNALRGLWNAQRQISVEEEADRENNPTEETIAILKKQGVWKDVEQASFSTRISVLLVLPLLQSQSRVDPQLCGVTSGVLLDCLRDCAPLSLSKEPGDCLKGLENLLCCWLGEDSDKCGSQPVEDLTQRKTIASALVALACARGHLKTFIHTVHLLQKLDDLNTLPVADVLAKLLETEGGQGHVPAVLGSKHVLCWGFEDLLRGAEKESVEKDKAECDVGKSLACDGVYLYSTNTCGRGLAKLGSGLHGSLRGYVYNKNTEIGAGKVAVGDGLVAYRPQSYDQDPDINNFFQLIDGHSLQPLKTIPKPEGYVEAGPCTTLQFCSDGSRFYWIWCPANMADKNMKGAPVYVEVFTYQNEDGTVVPIQPRITLVKKDDTSSKSLNETLLSRLRPAYRGSSNTLAALTGAENGATKKEDATTQVGITTCGAQLKSLVKCPIFVEGSHVIMLQPLAGGTASNAARSLFGSSGSLASMRSLASNVCFSLSDGQFAQRPDLLDAPSCALARGAPLNSMGVCFDVHNNVIWTSSSDWMDQYCNPAHQAPHHIRTRLGIQRAEPRPETADNEIAVSDVIQQLLQHVGGMVLHQSQSSVLCTPLGCYIAQQFPMDPGHLARICDILDTSITVLHTQTIICALIVLQLIYKVSVFKNENKGEQNLVQKTRSLVWKLLIMEGDSAIPVPQLQRIQQEACTVVTNGLTVLYPATEERHALLKQLLTDVTDKQEGLHCLRDMLLVDLADQLRAHILKTEHTEHLRLADDIVQQILVLTVRESCDLLNKSLQADKDQFEELLASIPIASPCVRYLMALQTHLLRDAVLSSVPETMSPDASTAKSHLTKLQTYIQKFSANVFTGSSQVLERLLDVSSRIIDRYEDELESRLQGLEKVAKCSVLGHLLPTLLTAMTHPHLRCLSMADTLMPRLVHLVVLTSQTALLLKSQVQTIVHEDVDVDSDSDIVDLIGHSIAPEKVELRDQEEQGFLAGLKIPAPWASGKTMESVHPVRDNYKFKETVHIPGARCLYLRFDPRCTSQYDYDKLMIHAGATTSAKKVVEYGGNTFGFGSRSVLGSGWPKDLVKVEGDTVTFSFEMRSGREHNTPDKAMWGFLITVRAQESPEEVSNGLPFLADLGLGLSVLACTLLHLLYQGPETTPEEVSCQHLLKSKLLQRCVWQSGAGVPTAISEATKQQQMPNISPRIPRIKLPAEILKNLLSLTAHRPPQLRPSIREVLQPDVMMEGVVSAVVKHMGLQETVRYFTPSKEHQTDDFMLLSSVMEEVCRRTDALLRQLQSLADLEQRWGMEVDDARQETNTEFLPFFHDYHLNETRLKELTMLCFVKDVSLDPAHLDDTAKELRQIFDTDIQATEGTAPKLKCTRQLVDGILTRLDLLLHVNISPADSATLTRTKSQCLEAIKSGTNVMVRSDTELLQPTSLLRSMSVPAGVYGFQDDTVLDLIRLHRRRPGQKLAPTSILQGLLEDPEDRDPAPHVALIGQLFSFIGSEPQKAISSVDFLKTAHLRWWRGNTRKQALVHIKELLSAASRVGGATHLVAAVTSVLRHGPRVEELTCGGMVNQVREAFAETMTSVVQVAARYPIACCNSIGLLCIVPYTRAEEKCLVRSGLVHLLDKLCSLANRRTDINVDSQSTRHKVSAMAWAGFQVLANRCVMWETEEGSHFEELEHSGLARQVSVLLTNHLARATETSGNEAAGTEALQEVLSLLNNLSRSHMGRAILSQPACVSKLLSLLLDQRPTPKLVLIILQLCRVALPLMDAVDCEQVELPSWGHGLGQSYWSTSQPISDPPARIVSLLLARLGDFLVPGDLATVASRQQSMDSDLNKGGEKEKGEDADIQNGRLSVFVHKREDQFSHEVIQPLLGSENRPFRLGGGSNMEKVVRLDREMTKAGKAELATEDAMGALRRAAKWAQMGLVVSTGPPVDSAPPEVATGDKKKLEKDIICREKNAELARTDPVRPFISGHVANSMAAEVIELLHSLMNAPVTNTARSWAEAVQRVLVNALSGLPVLLNSIESLSSPRCHTLQLMSMARLVNAALSALGGFREMVKPGCHVTVTGDVENSSGTVVSVSQITGQVTIQLDPDPEGTYSPRYSDTVQVPCSRIQPSRNQIYSTQQLSMTDAVVMATQAILLPQDDTSSHLQQRLPVSDDGASLTNQICRVVAELETRACLVLATYLEDINFAKEFIQHCGSTIDMLKSLAKECGTGERLQVVRSHCQRLRLLYRDCAKPPPPPSKVDSRNKEIVWDPSRNFPPVRACLFSHSMTGITFLGDPSAGSGLPRGTIVYANNPIPFQAPSFYWELEVCSFGDAQEESSAFVSFGFAPVAEKKDGAWTNPVGTCLFLNNGKAVHYNGSSLLQWRSVRLDMTIGAGDVAGVGWERTSEPPVQGQMPKGKVYFTYNGRRLQPTIEDVSGAMFPVVHIQKKTTRVKANFGSRPFAFAEGQQHREAADEADDLTREIRESFGYLPFNSQSDSDSEGPATASSTPSNVSEIQELPSVADAPCRTVPIPKPQKEYNPETSKFYKLFYSYDNMIATGPDPRAPQPATDALSDEEGGVEDDASPEDHHVLLVKAWEQKVFPVIRRRFRNEAERKDGLEQIRGALQLGMTDIARQTVEFLYEENGGMPRDLHLPTIDDIKEDLAKFTIDRVRKGTTVIVRTNPMGTGAAGTTVLPKFAVRSMLKTFGLTGTVLDIDNSNEMVQVETYLRSEGVLVRYWYPLTMLERPPQGLRKSTITGGQILDTCNINIHRELIHTERCVARMYCRTALLQLIDHCNSSAMEVISCSASLGSGMAASAALLQELDIENIQLLSNELLRTPQPHGTIKAKSLDMTDSSQHCLAAQSCSLSNLVYGNVDRLKKELAVAISRAANQGEDYLVELTNQICICLQTAPEMFPFEEYPVTETKVSTDVHFPGAACLIVSCKTDPKATKKQTSLYKSPWARIFCYSGQRIRNTGQVSKQEVVSYPRDTSSTSNHDDQYTPAIIPCDRIHLRVGVSPPPGIVVTIHALPSQFLLSLTYIETLITESHGCGTTSCTPPKQDEPDVWEQQFILPSPAVTEVRCIDRHPHESLWNLDNIVITPLVFSHMIEQLCGYIWRTDIPSLVKEYLFHLLAQSVRVYHYSEGGNGVRLPTPHPHLNPSHGLLVQLQAELKILYDSETKGWATGTTPSGAGIGIGISDQGRFSTYFHALMEANLAIGEMAKPSGRAKGGDSGLGVDVIPKTPTSPTHTSRRKKMKKREKKDGTSHRKLDTVPRTAESDVDFGLPQSPVASGSLPSLVSSASDQSTSYATASSSSASSVMSTPSTSQDSKEKDTGKDKDHSKESAIVKTIKPEDILWFHRALNVSHILRCLGFNEKNGTFFLVNAIADANQVLNGVTVHQRLLVITGIPVDMDPDMVHQSLRSVLKAHGGADRNEIFLPYDTIQIKKPSLSKVAETVKEGVSEAGKESNEASGSGAGMETSVDVVEAEGATCGEQEKEEAVVESADAVNVSKSSFNKESTDGEMEVKTKLKGYAVIGVLSKTKVDNVKKGLLKCRVLFDGTVGQDDPVEMPTISTVGVNLVAEEHANEPLEHFLHDKFLLNGDPREFNDTAMFALTEIFHSCFIVEQRHCPTDLRQESGYICLGKEQILQHTPENLLCLFFANIRPPKKSVAEQVTYVLRRYGMVQTPDKEGSPGVEKQGKGKGKKPQRSSKEKSLMFVERPGTKEKKSKDKTGADKYERDEEQSECSSKSTKGMATSVSKEECWCLTLDGFLQYVSDQLTQDVRSVWRAVLACGFDIHFDRCSCLDNSQAQQMARQWSLEMDTALTEYVNEFSRKMAVSPARLHPHEIYLSAAELSSEKYACLQGFPIESVRLRFSLLQFLNNILETFFLPLVDLRPSTTFNRSTAALLSKVRGLVFYDTKVNLMNRILNSTAQRKPDQAAPEITLDPLEAIGSEKETSQVTTLCQAFRQLANIPSSQLCVRLASGGDPTYSFNVKFTGEEVHGTSGSFRHFLWQIARELQGPLLNILVPSASANHKGLCILKPGPLTLVEERLITFFGQLLGTTIRADIPFGLYLAPSVWKSVVGRDLDLATDIKEADPLTYSYLKKIEMVETESELQALCADVYPRFMYPSLSGDEVELIPSGRHIPVCWENRHQYVDAIRQLRMCELRNRPRIQALQCGLASVLPLQVLNIMAPGDMEMRTCGLPHIDIEFLKAHTMYQVGLMETDRHIEYFWATLEALSQDDLCRFIKFACNQERIPQTCPCKDGGVDTAHVPPYPMKIAPPDGQGSADERYIRVETCMFMVKLPQYSSQQIMTQRLMYAIYCREDPLSG